MVLILGLFVPKSNVIVESSTKGEVQTVANVPLAVGLTAGTNNGMGQLITNFFETAFAPLGATSIYDEAYLDPLSFITKLNEKDPSLFFEAINDGVAASGVIVADAANDTELTLKNYVRECTRAGVDRGELNASDIESRPLFDPADITNSPLRWPHLVFTTEVRLNIGAGPAIQTLSCLEAWDHVAEIGCNRRCGFRCIRGHVFGIWPERRSGGSNRHRTHTSVDGHGGQAPSAHKI